MSIEILLRNGLITSFIVLRLPWLMAMTTSQSTSNLTTSLTLSSTSSSFLSNRASTSFLSQTSFLPTSLTLSSTTPTIIHLNTPDPFEETVTLKAADQTQTTIPIIYLRSVPCDYIAKDSPVIQLYKNNSKEHTNATYALVDKLNDNKYLQTKSQLNAFVTALELSYNKPKHVTSRTLAAALAQYLLEDEGLDGDDLIALWKAAQHLYIKPISAACAKAITMLTTLPNTTFLPMPLQQHLDLETTYQRNKDTTDIFCGLDECCLLDDIDSETKPTVENIWNSWQTNPNIKDLLSQLPRSQQQSELVSRYIMTHAIDTNFDFWYWYSKLPPDHLTDNAPRNKILADLDKLAERIIKQWDKNRCNALPEGYVKMRVRLAFFKAYHNLLDTIPIQTIQERLHDSKAAVDLSNLNLTSLDGIDVLLNLHNETEPIKTLLLDNNSLETLPPTFGDDWSSLQKLYLSKNLLTTLPISFGHNWHALTILYLSNNNLNKLPDGFGNNWHYLTWLLLDHNKLKALPNAFGKTWQILDVIRLEYNCLEMVPPHFTRKWHSLASINVTFNPCTINPTDEIKALLEDLKKRKVHIEY